MQYITLCMRTWREVRNFAWHRPGSHWISKETLVDRIWISKPVLNMILFPDRNPAGFCNSEPDPDWTGFWKILNRIGYGYPNCVDHCSEMFNESVFSDINRIRIGLDYTVTILDWIRIAKISDPFNTNPNCVDHCSQIFAGYKSDWFKCLGSTTGLQFDWITQWKYWTGLGSQKPLIHSTLPHVYCCCQIHWWVVLWRVKMGGVSI